MEQTQENVAMNHYYAVHLGDLVRKIALTEPTIESIKAKVATVYSDKISDGDEFAIRYYDSDLEEYVDLMNDVDLEQTKKLMVILKRPFIRQKATKRSLQKNTYSSQLRLALVRCGLWTVDTFMKAITPEQYNSIKEQVKMYETDEKRIRADIARKLQDKRTKSRGCGNLSTSTTSSTPSNSFADTTDSDSELHMGASAQNKTLSPVLVRSYGFRKPDLPASGPTHSTSDASNKVALIDADSLHVGSGYEVQSTGGPGVKILTSYIKLASVTRKYKDLGILDGNVVPLDALKRMKIITEPLDWDHLVAKSDDFTFASLYTGPEERWSGFFYPCTLKYPEPEGVRVKYKDGTILTSLIEDIWVNPKKKRLGH